MAINYQFFSKDNCAILHELTQIINVFIKHSEKIDSYNKTLRSKDVVDCLANDLEQCGYIIKQNGSGPDAYNKQEQIIVEVEAGRGLTNNQFLKDLLEACMMVNVKYLVIAIRNIYGKQRDYDKVVEFLNRLYSSDKIVLPLRGVLIIGY